MERISSRFIAPPIFIKSTELVANHDIFEYRQSPCHEGWLIVWCKNDEDEEEEEELIINSISSRGGRIRRRWKMGDCFLWNSTTFESIMLPSLYSFFEDDPYPGPYSCILSSPPTSNNNNSMVFFTFSNGDIGVQDLWFLLFCHPGDKQWRKQEYSLFNAFFLFCFRGTKLPYIMAISDHIHVIGKLEPQISISSFEVKNSSLHPAEGEKIACAIRINYVECCYELFKIVRAYHYDKGSSFRRERLLYIKISKLDLRAPPPSPPSWVKVENMGNHVLFLGDNTVASFSAAELGLTKGCVYFTERTEDNLYKFDLEDDSIYVHPLPPYSYSSEEEEEEEDPPLMPPLSLSSLQDWVRLVDGRSGSNDEEGAEKTTLPASDQVVVDYNYANIVQPPTTATSPHLVFLRRECPVWNFIDPMHNNHKYHSEIPLLDDATIHFSKGCWLLMSRGKTNIFFFNPFTRVTICLPDLEKYYMFSGVSFSSLPTSPDCVIFGIAGQREGHVCISISRGDDSWFYNTELPSQEEHLAEEFKVSFNNPVFLNGVFYCIDKYGTLGVYEKQHNVCKWKVLDKPEKPSTNGDIYMSFLVECQGELLSVFLGHLGEDVWVFRLDLSNMNWVEVKSLQKHMLFISHTSSISAIAPNSMMENQIFFARLGRGDKILYYCLETSRYYCFGSQHSAEDFYGTKTHLNCSWIEPNWSDNAGQELDWNNV